MYNKKTSFGQCVWSEAVPIVLEGLTVNCTKQITFNAQIWVVFLSHSQARLSGVCTGLM